MQSLLDSWEESMETLFNFILIIYLNFREKGEVQKPFVIVTYRRFYAGVWEKIFKLLREKALTKN